MGTEVRQNPATGRWIAPALSDAMVEVIASVGRNGRSFASGVMAAGFSRSWATKFKSIAERGTYQRGEPVPPLRLAQMRKAVRRWEEELLVFEENMTKVMIEGAASINVKTGIPEWRAAHALLTHGPTRENWHPHREPAVVVAARTLPPERGVVRTLSDEDLFAIDAEFRELVPTGEVT